MPSAFAVLRLITSSNLVGCCTGRSAGFSPLRISAGVDATLPIGIGDAYPVAQQSARHGIFAKLIDGGQPLPFRKSDDPLALRIEVRVGREQQRAHTFAVERRECCLEFIVGAGVCDNDR